MLTLLIFENTLKPNKEALILSFHGSDICFKEANIEILLI